jgi:hypothetical protein
MAALDPLTVVLAVNGTYGQIQVVRKKARGFIPLVAGQLLWLAWEARLFAITWPLMVNSLSYLVIYVWGWRSWRTSPEKTEKEVPVKETLKRAREIALATAFHYDLVEYGLMLLFLSVPLALAVAGSVVAGTTGLTTGMLLGTAVAVWGTYKVPAWTERADAWKAARR